MKIEAANNILKYEGNRKLELRNRTTMMREECTGNVIFLFRKPSFLHDKKAFERAGIDPRRWNIERFEEELKEGFHSENIFSYFETLCIFGSRDEGIFHGETKYQSPFQVFGKFCESKLASILDENWDEFVKNNGEIDIKDEFVVYIVYDTLHYYYWDSLTRLGFLYDDNYQVYEKRDEKELSKMVVEALKNEFGDNLKSTDIESIETFKEEFIDENDEKCYTDEQLVKMGYAETYLHVMNVCIDKDDADAYVNSHEHHFSGKPVIKPITCRGAMARMLEQWKKRERKRDQSLQDLL